MFYFLILSGLNSRIAIKQFIPKRSKIHTTIVSAVIYTSFEAYFEHYRLKSYSYLFYSIIVTDKKDLDLNLVTTSGTVSDACQGRPFDLLKNVGIWPLHDYLNSVVRND